MFSKKYHKTKNVLERGRMREDGSCFQKNILERGRMGDGEGLARAVKQSRGFGLPLLLPPSNKQTSFENTETSKNC